MNASASTPGNEGAGGGLGWQGGDGAETGRDGEAEAGRDTGRRRAGRDGEAEAGRDTGRIWGGEMTCSAVFPCGLQLRMALTSNIPVTISCVNKADY